MIDPNVKQALITSIENLVSRLVSSSGLTPEQVNVIVEDYVNGRIADDTAASAGVSETELTSVRGAYLAALKMLEDEFVSSPEDLDSISEVTAAIVALRESLGDIEDTLTGLTHAFVFRDEIQGGADEENAFDLATLSEKSGGSYYKVTQSGWFVLEDGVGTPFEAYQKDGIVFKPDGTVFVDGNVTSTVEGTVDEINVTGSVETGFVASLAQAVKDRLDAADAAVDAVNALEEEIDTLATKGNLNIGTTVNGYLSTALADVNGHASGTYHGYSTKAQAGIAGEGAEVVAITVTIIEVDEGINRLEFQAQRDDFTWNRSYDGSTEDSENAGQATVTEWFSPRSEIEELIVALTEAFDDAAQPED